jgi:hypothetical protein
MTRPPDLSDDHDRSGARRDDEDSQDGGAVEPLIEHAEAGWRLGWDYLEQHQAGADPDLARLGAAIEHLEIAVLDGVNGVVLRDPELLRLLGLLLLVLGEAEGAVDAVDEAHAAFAEGLECRGLEEPVRLGLLDGVRLACRNRVALLESGADVYHPRPELAAARDALVAAAEALFLAVPPEHEGGVQVLRGHALRVLLQSGTQDAITTARAASGDSHEVVTWCLADGADDQAIAALETGRGLTLLAAGATGSVSDRLEAIGEPGLAQAWRHSQDAVEPGPADGLTVPEDVRHRVLDRLAASGDLADVLRPPDRDGLGATLRQLGYDALVYLVPQGRSAPAYLGAARPVRPGSNPDRPGGALMVTAGGQVYWQDLPGLAVGPESVIGSYLRAHRALLGPGGTPDDRDAWRDTLQQTCQWAWTAAMGPLRPTLSNIHCARRARVVLVPVDALCVVPWHAAYPASDHRLPPSERRYALDAVTFSYAASGALLSRIARRSPPVVDSSVLLVGDPGGDLPYAQAETQALRTAFYPGATTWGEPPQLTDATATPARLRAALADGGHSLFHYAGHATVDAAQPGSSALVLGDQRLRADGISRLTPRKNYCVCLAACTTHLAADAFDEVFTLSTAFLLGGASTVLGSLWRMKDAGTVVLMFLIHHYLSRGARPVDALHRAQMWMLNPDRRIPESMPDLIRDALPGLDLTDPVVWAGLTHQGH